MKETILKLIRIIQSQEVEESTSRKDELWQNTIAKAQLKIRRQRIRKLTMGIAAAAAVIVGVFVYNTQLYDESFYVPIELVADNMLVDDDSSDVVLRLSDSEVLVVDNKSSIKVSETGDILVNGNGIANVYEMDAHSQVVVPRGKRATLVLSDESMLTINSGSRVVFPRIFNGEKREVFVDGEAYLEVSSNKEMPFVVKTTEEFQVEVLGTSFNICTYKELSESSVVLLEGAVRVSDASNKVVNLSPNQMVSISNNILSESMAVDARDYTGWMDGVLVLHSQSLKNVAERLEIHFGENIEIEEDIYDIRISGKLDLNGSLSSILSGLTNIIISPTTYHKADNGIHILKRE